MPDTSLPAMPPQPGGTGVQPRMLARASVDAAHAALTRLVGRGLQLALPDGVTFQVAFDAAHGRGGSDVIDQAGQVGKTGGAVLLDSPHGPLYLAAGMPFLLALTGIDPAAADDAPAAQRDWLDAALLGRLGGPPLGGTPLGGVTRLVRRPARPAGGVALRLSLHDGTHLVDTLALADAACWHALLAAAALRPVRLPHEAFAGLPLAIPVRLARHALAPAVLRGLRPGDVIVPARPDIDVDGAGWLRCAGLLARVRYGRTGTIHIFSLEAAMATDAATAGAAAPAWQNEQHDQHGSDQHEEHEGHEEHEEHEEHEGNEGNESHAAPASRDLDRMPVQLEFRLGALALTLGQLRALAPGAVLQLDGAADGAVAIVCGGQRLGEAEPVDVAGRLGLRITRWDVPC